MQTDWRLRNSPWHQGGDQRLYRGGRCCVQRAPAVFWASATAGPALDSLRFSDSTERRAWGAFANPIQVAVTDSYKNPVSGFEVQFSVVKGDGVFSNARSC
jgi:hypothetical protein